MICDLELIRDIRLLYEKEMVIWGAGNSGKMVYNKLRHILKIPLNAGGKISFCDTDPAKWEERSANVVSPDELFRMAAKKRILILIASDYVNEIVGRIEQMGLMEIADVCTWFALQMAMRFHIDEEIFTEEFKESYVFEKQLYLESLEACYLYHFLGDKIGFFYTASYDQPIYTIQPGKVGSTTILSSLKKRKIPCAKSHRLSFLKDDGDENASQEDVRVFRKVFAERKAKGMKIIVTVREPISRDISAFWFSIDELAYTKVADPDFIVFFKKFLKEVYGPLGDLELAPFKVCHQRSKMQPGDQGKWFRETIEELFSIDVFTHPFDKKKGYTVIRQDNIQMLILQMEKMNELEAVIGAFVGVEEFVLESENEAKTRLSYPAQREFMEKVVLPRDYVERCYGKESFIHHFYSEADQAKFLAKWKKHIQ